MVGSIKLLLGRALLTGAIAALGIAAAPSDSAAVPLGGPSAPSRPGMPHQYRYSHPGRPGRAPELDPQSAGAALVLVSGGMLLLSERRRRRQGRRSA